MSSQINVTALVTVELTVSGFWQNIGLQQVTDCVSDLFSAGALHLELVSTQIDPLLGSNGGGKPKGGKARLNLIKKKEATQVIYEAKLKVNASFGKVGGILVTNEHAKELYVKHILLQGLTQGDVLLTCESWIHSKFDNPQKRIFFTNESYLPSQTPIGLKNWREEELKNLRGDGHGMRKHIDRVYDYDVYNDLGNPDKKPELGRPVLGGQQHPYPRRCRTGRPPCKSDPLSETRSGGSFYKPRDEVFEDLKKLSFSTNILDNVLHSVLPAIEDSIADTTLGFFNFDEINELYRKGMKITDVQNVLRFPTPDIMQRDQFAWFRDEEFARETLAGPNPCSIKLVKDWPLMSKLDPEIYGLPESLITKELVEQEIKGVMSFTEALEQKKLFMLDYHDVLLPYVNKVREIKGTTLYGSRTLFFLTPKGTLRPIAIELTRPPNAKNGTPQWKQVYTPSFDATGTWLWRLAKAHVLAHDSAHHQVVSHWLRTHCCVEPYIIATNRQLSALHPIGRLMMPYFRYTMEINSLAREALINADGVIETTFSTERYSMEFGSMVYDKEWRFDHQALPSDLISRGMAIEDESSPHGLKLMIEDYPFANDGLLLWDVIKEWVTDYVKHYYENEQLIQSDQELQNWWTDIKNEGHADKKNAPGWPTLSTPDDLIAILTNMIWVTSGHHSAVNFGQYTYGGYFSNRPTIARIKMPSEDPTETEWSSFLANPCKVLLNTLPSRIQGTKVMTILNVLSSHSPDEEYIGDQIEPSWAEDPSTKASFDKFHSNLKKMESVIDSRNADEKLNNRNGAGIIPYQLLKPYSKSGVTSMGVPNSISI